MNLHLWVTYSGDHSLAALGAYFTTSLPFDLAHVVGNVVFCLVFGPALVRALTRYRQRFEVTWRPLPALAAAAARRARARQRRAPRRPQAAVPPRALSWLEQRPERRRRLRRRARPALERPLQRAGPALGLAAAGRNPRDVARGGADVVAYLRAHPPGRSADLGEHHARDPAPARGRRWRRGSAAATSCASCSPGARASGAFAGRVNTTAFAIFALRAAGRSRSDRAVRSGARWIASQANPDGGFNFAGKGGGSGIDDTGAALQALVAAGRAARRRSAAPRASSPAARTPTAATRCSPAAPPTPSRPRGRSRRSSRPAATPTASAATAPARRPPTCARS